MRIVKDEEPIKAPDIWDDLTLKDAYRMYHGYQDERLKQACREAVKEYLDNLYEHFLKPPTNL